VEDETAYGEIEDADQHGGVGEIRHGMVDVSGQPEVLEEAEPGEGVDGIGEVHESQDEE